MRLKPMGSSSSLRKGRSSFMSSLKACDMFVIGVFTNLHQVTQNWFHCTSVSFAPSDSTESSKASKITATKTLSTMNVTMQVKVIQYGYVTGVPQPLMSTQLGFGSESSNSQ